MAVKLADEILNKYAYSFNHMYKYAQGLND